MLKISLGGGDFSEALSVFATRESTQRVVCGVVGVCIWEQGWEGVFFYSKRGVFFLFLLCQIYLFCLWFGFCCVCWSSNLVELVDGSGNSQQAEKQKAPLCVLTRFFVVLPVCEIRQES